VFQAVLRSAAFVGGTEVSAFEQEFARYCEVAEAVAVNSGTDALRFAYIAAGIKPGDEVITVPNTFIATTEALSQAGAKIRFVDVLPGTLLMDPNCVAAAITPRTRGIVPVHLYGMPADLKPLLDLAARGDLWLIEDAAQAHGARYRGRRCGSLGTLAAFSFYPGKNLGACGEGGAIVSNDSNKLALTRKLRDHGQRRKYYHDMEGYNGRLDAIQAAFLRVKLRHLENWNEARRSAAQTYHERLVAIGDVQLLSVPADVEPVYHLYVIRIPERDRVQEFLRSRGIETGLHYPVPLHLQEAYRHLGLGPGSFPVAEQSAREILSLPLFPEITAAQIEYVCDNLAEFFRGRKSWSAQRVAART
jgi:dTDP-4-amino-4,6-dideoxygalactose transaminase